MEEWEKIEESFNCGDTDLNDFILHEAPLYREALLAVSCVASPLLSALFRISFCNSRRSSAKAESGSETFIVGEMFFF